VPDNRRCIVIGAGIVGLSSAWALSRRGWQVTVLEAAARPGHARAGSRGDARIFRLGYPDPAYVEMAILALATWRELEGATGRDLLHTTGQVTFGDEAVLRAIAAALAAAGAPAAELAAVDARQRFPGLVPTGAVLVEPQSGVLAADECLEALTQTGRFDLRVGSPVASLHHDTESVSLRQADGTTWRAEIVVDCAGPAALGLLGIPTPRAATASLPQVAYFAPRDPGRLPPIFIEWGDDMVYGLPVAGRGPHAGTYKVSQHAPGTALAPFDPSDPAPLAGDDPTLLGRLADAVGRLLPSLERVPVGTERCVYDNSADTDFVLDRVGRVVIGCGTSGHAFKFGPLLGELLADLAEDRPPAVDLNRFRLGPTPPAGTGSVPPSR
jgi:sarcosine oxidase